MVSECDVAHYIIDTLNVSSNNARLVAIANAHPVSSHAKRYDLTAQLAEIIIGGVAAFLAIPPSILAIIGHMHYLKRHRRPKEGVCCIES